MSDSPAPSTATAASAVPVMDTFVSGISGPIQEEESRRAEAVLRVTALKTRLAAAAEQYRSAVAEVMAVKTAFEAEVRG